MRGGRLISIGPRLERTFSVTPADDPDGANPVLGYGTGGIGFLPVALIFVLFMFLTKSQIALYAQHDDNAEPHPSESWRDIADLAAAALLFRCSGR